MSIPEDSAATKVLLTAEEAAQALSIGRTRVFRLIATGQLRSILIGKSRRVPMRALEEFVAGLERVHRMSSLSEGGVIIETASPMQMEMSSPDKSCGRLDDGRMPRSGSEHRSSHDTCR